MIWLTWRQFRTQAWVASAVLAVIAAVLAITGLRMARLYDSSGVAACHPAACATLASNFLNELSGDKLLVILYYATVVVVYAAPALIGAFWGAPLITREFETGTFRLAWNQSVSRTRWLAAKLGLLGLAAMAAVGLLSLMATWWFSPVRRVATLLSARRAGGMPSLLDPVMFSTHGIVPVGYAAFGFALGVTVGLLIRRTVPAMAIALVVFAGVQLAMPVWVRPSLFTPLTSTMTLDANNLTEIMMGPGGKATVLAAVNLPGSWVLSNQTIDTSGHVFSGPMPQACGTQGPQACQAALGQLHLRQLVTYQPASRYWPLQWYELGIFLALSLLLSAFCFWWIRRRRLA